MKRCAICGKLIFPCNKFLRKYGGARLFKRIGEEYIEQPDMIYFCSNEFYFNNTFENDGEIQTMLPFLESKYATLIKKQLLNYEQKSEEQRVD